LDKLAQINDLIIEFQTTGGVLHCSRSQRLVSMKIMANNNFYSWVRI